MNNIEAAFVLIRAEADRRIEDADHHDYVDDYVGTIHEVMMEVSSLCGELMKATREEEWKAKRKNNRPDLILDLKG